MGRDVRYIYLTEQEKVHNNMNGVICIGYKKVDEGFHFGFSFCAKGDPFTKKEAHERCNNRLNLNPYSYKTDNSNYNYQDMIKLVKIILFEILTSDNKVVNAINIPTWIKKYIYKEKKMMEWIQKYKVKKNGQVSEN